MRKIIVTALIVLSLAYLSAVDFGISYGIGAFNYSYNTGSPKNLNVHVFTNINPNTKLGISGGYGISTYKNKINYSDSAQPDNKLDQSIKGLQIESELLFGKFEEFSLVNPFIGIGLGYYKFSYVSEEDSGYSYNDDEDDFTWVFNGLAQYFTFGFDVNINYRLTAFLQLKKMGFSFVKFRRDLTNYDYETDHDEVIGSVVGDYNASWGLIDTGISFGFRYKL